jgi:hypothetical protein
MAKTTPLLLVLYLLQALLYQRFAPAPLAGDVNVFLGVGLALIIFCYHFYDHHHRVILRPNYLELRLDVLGVKEEILYRNIVHIEIRRERHGYANILLHQRDGAVARLYHVDSPDLIVSFIEKKQSRRGA